MLLDMKMCMMVCSIWFYFHPQTFDGGIIVRVCIPGGNQGPGGPNSFKRNIIRQLNDVDIHVTTDFAYKDVDVVLLVGGTRNFNWLKRIKKSNIPLVQRLGPINWLHKYDPITSKHKWVSLIRNSILFKIREKYADHVIYQSQFCLDWWCDTRGIDAPRSSVILNGVDRNLFEPKIGYSNSNNKLKLISVEGNLSYTEQVYKTPLELNKMLNEKGIDSELTLIGELNHKGIVELNRYDNVHYLGSINHSEMRDILVRHDVFVSGEINPACPNGPLEAMACGLPVVGFNTGALSELVLEDSGICADYGGNPWELESPNMGNLLESTNMIKDQLSYYSNKAVLNIQHNFSLSNMTDEYVKVFKTLV